MRYVPNPAFISIFQQSPKHEEIRQEAAERIANRARAIAPVDTGAYRESIRVIDGQVVADIDYAAVIEFGSIDTPTFSPLRRAAIAEFGTNALRG